MARVKLIMNLIGVVGNSLEIKDIKDKYDAVIGNPPYNKNSKNKGKNHILWDKFVDVALKCWLKPNGYLLYVHPSLWRQLGHPLLSLLKNKQILYLEIHNVKDGIKTFKKSTRYDWYLLENKNKYKNTEIKDEEGKNHSIDLTGWGFYT